MAKKIADRDAVFSAADQLKSEGGDPSIIAVQERVGGGSYTTIKRLLDEWQKERIQKSVELSKVPVDLSSKGADLVHTIWSAANALAQKDVVAIQEKAAQKLEVARRELAEATAEITRLEAIENDLIAENERIAAQLREMELMVARLEVDAARVAELQQDLDRTKERLIQSEQRLAQLQQTGATISSDAVSVLLAELQKRLPAIPSSIESDQGN